MSSPFAPFHHSSNPLPPPSSPVSASSVKASVPLLSMLPFTLLPCLPCPCPFSSGSVGVRESQNLRISLNGFRFAACVLQCICGACIQPSPYPFLHSSIPFCWPGPDKLVTHSAISHAPCADDGFYDSPHEHISRAIFGVALAFACLVSASAIGEITARRHCGRGGARMNGSASVPPLAISQRCGRRRE